MKISRSGFVVLCVVFAIILGAFFSLFGIFKKTVSSYELERERVSLLLDSLSVERGSRKSEQLLLSSRIDSLSVLYSQSQESLLKSKQSYSSLYSKYVKSTSGLDKVNDSVSVADCDEVLESADRYIVDLSSSLAVCDSVSTYKSVLISSMALDTLSYSRSLRELSALSDLQSGLIKDYKKRQGSWWHKNKFWVGVVGGAVLTGTIVGVSR